MSATAESPARGSTSEPKADADLRRLLRHLADKDKAAIHSLPNDLRRPELLATALAKGYVEVGRRDHSFTVDEVKIVKGPDGKPLYREGRPVVERSYKTNLEDGWSWNQPLGPKFKPLREILKDDAEADEEVRLHLRLTTEGLAAAV